MRGRRHRVRRAEDRASTASPSSPPPRTPTSPASTFADLYALIGPESEGFATGATRTLWRRSSTGSATSGQPTLVPDAPLEVTAPARSRGPSTASSSRHRRHRRRAGGRRPGGATRLHGLAQRQRHHRGHQRQRHLARLGRLRVRRGEPRATRSLEIDGGTAASSDRRPRRSPTARTRSPATSSSTSTTRRPREPGGRRLRRLLPRRGPRQGRRRRLRRPDRRAAAGDVERLGRPASLRATMRLVGWPGLARPVASAALL